MKRSSSSWAVPVFFIVIGGFLIAMGLGIHAAGHFTLSTGGTGRGVVHGGRLVTRESDPVLFQKTVFGSMGLGTAIVVASLFGLLRRRRGGPANAWRERAAVAALVVLAFAWASSLRPKMRPTPGGSADRAAIGHSSARPHPSETVREAAGVALLAAFVIALLMAPIWKARLEASRSAGASGTAPSRRHDDDR